METVQETEVKDFNVKVVHVIDSKKMNYKAAIEYEENLRKKLDGSTKRKLGIVNQLKLKQLLPKAARGTFSDIVLDSEQQMKNNIQIVPTEVEDMFVVETSNVIKEFTGFSLSEAEECKERLKSSIGKITGKDSKLVIEIEKACTGV